MSAFKDPKVRRMIPVVVDIKEAQDRMGITESCVECSTDITSYSNAEYEIATCACGQCVCLSCHLNDEHACSSEDYPVLQACLKAGMLT